MATIFRLPLTVRIERRDSSGAANTPSQQGSPRALLSSVSSSFPPFGDDAGWQRPNRVAYPYELYTWLNGSITALTSVLPVSMFGWNDTATPRLVQQPFDFPNFALRNQPVPKPFAQTDWPNPVCLLDYQQRGTTLRDGPTLTPPALSLNRSVDWPNPVRAPLHISNYVYQSGGNALQITPVVAGSAHAYQGLYIGIRIGF